MFRDIFSFDGRIRRLEYGLSYLGFIAYSRPFVDPFASNSGFVKWATLLKSNPSIMLMKMELSKVKKRYEKIEIAIYLLGK